RRKVESLQVQHQRCIPFTLADTCYINIHRLPLARKKYNVIIINEYGGDHLAVRGTDYLHPYEKCRCFAAVCKINTEFSTGAFHHLTHYPCLRKCSEILPVTAGRQPVYIVIHRQAG